MGFQINFTSLTNFVFLYLSLRLFTEGVEEFLIQPTAWYYMKYLGESDLFLGLTLAAYSAGALLFAPFVGVLEVKFQASKMITVFCAFVRFFGNLLYSIPINGYFPFFGRLTCGLGAATEGVLFGVVAKGTSNKNRAKAFLYLEGLYSLGTIFGPTLGSLLTFNMDIYGWQINAGNSPGIILIFIWLALLLSALFLPSDLAENAAINERSVIEEEEESDHDATFFKTIVESSHNGSATSEMGFAATSSKVTAVVQEDDENDISLSKSVREHGCPPSSIVFCLYYLICLSLFVYMVISFYVPLLAKYHLGLGLSHVKLIYVNSSLFVSVLFFATSLFLDKISEKNFLFLTIFAQVIPISITFYFGLSWNGTMSVNQSYLLLCSMLFLSSQFLNIPVASSVLSKITPVKSASFYQSLTYTAVHLGMCFSRLAAGATFGRMPMIYTSAILASFWLFGMLWLVYEYRNFSRRVTNTEA